MLLEVAVLYGCDLSQVFTLIILRLYQPHSLCEKGATKAAAKAALYVFLLPPLREGRRNHDLPAFTACAISTHAPARGATKCRRAPSRRRPHFHSRPYARGDKDVQDIVNEYIIFLLPPLREGRLGKNLARKPGCGQFLLPPLREGRPYDVHDIRPYNMISIRAPTRGATQGG